MVLVLLRNYFRHASKISFSQTLIHPTKKFCDLSIRNKYNMSSDVNHLVWVDLEMTGLDVENDKILEIACLITNTDLNVIAEGPDIIIHQPESVLQSMGEWCKEHHGKSGLTKAVQNSTTSVQVAEKQVLEFVRKHTQPKKCLLAGNSVHVDKTFLNKYMPNLVDHLYYRIVDVSTVKELCKFWLPKTYENAPRKAGNHRALDDIKESLEELKFYKSAIFK